MASAATFDTTQRLARAEHALSANDFDVTVHPYGFYVIAPTRQSEREEVRFHVWSARERSEQIPHWPVHSHNANMQSLVVSGGLTNRTWSSSPVSDGHPLYCVKWVGQVSMLEPAGKTVLLADPVDALARRGHVYAVPKGVFHETQVVAQSACVTLCWFERPAYGPSYVVGESPREALAFNRKAFLPGDAETALSTLHSALAEWRATNPFASAP